MCVVPNDALRLREKQKYCKLDWEETGAWRPRDARARDFVNFRRKKIMHRAHVARPLGIDSLPSLDPD